MKTWKTWICVLLLTFLGSGAPTPAQTVATRHVMQEKLAQTQSILEALMTSNFRQLQEASETLALAPRMPGWDVLKTPEYARHSTAFLSATEALVQAATDRDLDAAAINYTSLTMTCYRCHRYLKNTRIADVAGLPAIDAETDHPTGPQDPPQAEETAQAKRRTPPAGSPSADQARPRPPTSPPTGQAKPRTPPSSADRSKAPSAPTTPRAVPRRPAPPNPQRRVEIYPYPFWPPPPFIYRFPYPYWWEYYPYSPYAYPAPAPEWTIEATRYGRVLFDIPQKDAMVFVDSFYAGVVGDFDDGRDLILVPGPHHIELRLEGFEPLTLEVNSIAGQSTTVHSPMQPAKPGSH